jgi:hypothetical protein
MKNEKILVEDITPDDIIWVGDKWRLVKQITPNLNNEFVIEFDDDSYVISKPNKKYSLM